MVSNITRLVVVLVGSVVVPEEIQVLRVRRWVLTLLIVLGSLIDDGRELGKRAGVTGSALALRVRHDGLVEYGTDVDASLANSGRIASHALQSKVTTHGHNIGYTVRVGEGDGVVGELVLGDVNIQGGNDGSDVGIVSTGWLLENGLEVESCRALTSSRTSFQPWGRTASGHGWHWHKLDPRQFGTHYQLYRTYD